MFLGSGSRNEPNSHQLARIDENKIFHELDVHHVQKVGVNRFWVQKVGMKSFWAQEAGVCRNEKIFLTAISRNQTWARIACSREENFS